MSFHFSLPPHSLVFEFQDEELFASERGSVEDFGGRQSGAGTFKIVHLDEPAHRIHTANG